MNVRKQRKTKKEKMATELAGKKTKNRLENRRLKGNVLK